MAVMKGARDMNLYCLKDNTVTGVMAASVDSDDDATKLWYMKLDHTGEKSMQTLTYKLKFCEHCVLSKKKNEV